MSFYEDPYCVLPGSGSSTAREWAIANAGRAHPAFATPSRYDEQRAQLIVRKQMEYVGVRAFLCEGFTANFLYPSAVISDSQEVSIIERP